jgi:hypothetical protein
MNAVKTAEMLRAYIWAAMEVMERHNDRADIVETGKEKIETLLAAEEVVKKQIPQPIEEWGEDDHDCLWWKFPIEEPPYCGNPLDSEWEGNKYGDYYTHFTRLTVPELN